MASYVIDLHPSFDAVLQDICGAFAPPADPAFVMRRMVEGVLFSHLSGLPVMQGLSQAISQEDGAVAAHFDELMRQVVRG